MIVDPHVGTDLCLLVEYHMVSNDAPRPDCHICAHDGERPNAHVIRKTGRGMDLSGGMALFHGDRMLEVRVASGASYPHVPMSLFLAALAPTPEGYGTGLELLPVLSFVLPILVLIAIWFFGSRRIV